MCCGAMPVIIFKIHGLGLCYLRDYHLLVVSTHSIWSSRLEILRVLSVKEYQLVGIRSCVFSVIAHAFGTFSLQRLRWFQPCGPFVKP